MVFNFTFSRLLLGFITRCYTWLCLVFCSPSLAYSLSLDPDLAESSKSLCSTLSQASTECGLLPAKQMIDWISHHSHITKQVNLSHHNTDVISCSLWSICNFLLQCTLKSSKWWKWIKLPWKIWQNTRTCVSVTALSQQNSPHQAYLISLKHGGVGHHAFLVEQEGEMIIRRLWKHFKHIMT